MILSTEKTEYSVPADVQYVEDYGNRVGFYFNVNGQEMVSIMQEHVVQEHADLYWNIQPNKLHFFDYDTEMNVGYPEE